ncbi:MAG TPA: class I SAM-dependent methyltransferase [Streptosporangiaceae bacterium]|jgi:SAM-dependent methyltransferase
MTPAGNPHVNPAVARPSGAPPAGHGQPGARHGQATSFGAAAAEYERGRPPYPAAAIDWLLPPGAARVADVGAGTGKLTKQLRERGVEVIAVEPLAGMREQLRRAVPGVAVLAGTAEQIPLADGSVDAVLVAQAWHWVTPGRAIPEVARVLSPGGRLGVLWNLRDERDGLVARLSTIMQSWESPDAGGHQPDFGEPFGPVERLDVEWVFRLSPGALVDYVASRSYIITMEPQQRAHVLDSVRELVATYPSVAGASEVSLPQVTRCSRADLPS